MLPHFFTAFSALQFTRLWLELKCSQLPSNSKHYSNCSKSVLQEKKQLWLDRGGL